MCNNKVERIEMCFVYFLYGISIKAMDVNKMRDHSTLHLRHKFKQRNSASIAFLHFTVTAGFSTISKIHTLK